MIIQLQHLTKIDYNENHAISFAINNERYHIPSVLKFSVAACNLMDIQYSRSSSALCTQSIVGRMQRNKSARMIRFTATQHASGIITLILKRLYVDFGA